MITGAPRARPFFVFFVVQLYVDPGTEILTSYGSVLTEGQSRVERPTDDRPTKRKRE